ncbi:MAG: hypothetical protein Q7S86_02220 [bacterium]|nr:hypothetical protein [bacterium]
MFQSEKLNVVARLTSPATRAIDTLIWSTIGLYDSAPIAELSELYTPVGAPGAFLNGAMKAFETRWKEYFADPISGPLLDRLGQRAAREIAEFTVSANIQRGVVLIATHGPLCFKIAESLAALFNPEAENRAMAKSYFESRDAKVGDRLVVSHASMNHIKLK